MLLSAGGVYSLLLEPGWIAVEKVRVRLKRLPSALNGFNIVQMSDFHRGRHIRDAELQVAVDVANRLKPDLIVLTGDYVTSNESFAQPCAKMLAGLHAPHGVIAILGNHDHWTDADVVSRALRSHSIQLLRNDAAPITHHGARLWIVGVDDVWQKKANLPLALQRVPKEAVTILLAHEPDYADTASGYPIDLQLSGHSHGGQVRLPFLGAPILPYLAEKYPWGLRRVGEMQVYTNRGIGVIGPPVRLGCRPEVTLLTLVS
jgi:hypothetical protein